MIAISEPNVSEEGDKTIYRCSILDRGEKRELWFEVPTEFGDLVSEGSEAALVALLLPAMARGLDIRMHGPVSPGLLQNLRGPFQETIRQIIPTLQSVSIHADPKEEHVHRATGVATGFTLGVDSFTVIREHHLRPIQSVDRLTHLVFLNVGSHYRGGRDLYRRRLARVREVALSLRLPLIPIDSNIDSFYPSELTFSKSMTIRNVGACYVLQAGIGKYLVASGVHRSSQSVGPAHNIQFAEDYLLPLLASESLITKPSGSEHRRFEKIELVADLEQSYDCLCVCNEIADGGTANCSHCNKCMRTMLMLDVLGLLERYKSVFDLDRYEKNRGEFIARFYFQKNYVNGELTNLIEETGYAIPLGAKLMILFRIMAVRRLFQRISRRLTRTLGLSANTY